MDQNITGWRRYMLVQPSMMILIFAQSISGTILTDLIVSRTCSITLGINETECMILHKNSSSTEALRINLQVQPHVTLIVMSKSFIESFFPAFLTLLLGPWSDKYGRKLVILSGYIGITASYVLLSIMANWEIAPWYLLLAFVPMALMGGNSVLMLASLCYITDITDNNIRAWHLAWLDALINVGLLSGIFSGPLIFEAYGYTTVFIISTVSCTVATLYILLCVPETIQSQNYGNIYKMFDLMLLKDLFNTCIRKRHGFNRTIVWSCIACLILLLFSLQGEISVGYLFSSARFGWTVDNYSTYVGSSIMLGICGTIFSLKFLRKYIGVPEAIIAVIAATSSLGSALVRALAWQSWHMYLSASIGTLGDVSRSMIRTILSKSVPSQDTGKVFSVTVSLETVLPFAATSLYSLIYTLYMPPLYPQPVWFLSAAFHTVTIILLINIQMQIAKCNDRSYVSLLHNTDPDH